MVLVGGCPVILSIFGGEDDAVCAKIGKEGSG